MPGLPNFKTKIARLQRSGKNVLSIGKGKDAWVMFFCPQSGHYYAMDMKFAIPSGANCIRKAYRIDPKTGTAEHVNNEPRTFAVKISSAIRENREMAQHELNALSLHQFTEELMVDSYGVSYIISEFYSGEQVSAQNPLVYAASFAQRIHLIWELALQYFRIHTHPWMPHIHADIKPQNVMISKNPEGTLYASVIDYGSVRVMNFDEKDQEKPVPTALGGLSVFTIPRETIEQFHPYQSLDQKWSPLDNLEEEKIHGSKVLENNQTGNITSKSDVYTLAPIFAMLLGVQEPYYFRQEAMKKVNSYETPLLLRLLDEEIKAGFNFRGLFPEQMMRLTYQFDTEQDSCGFYRRVGNPPSDEALLTDPSIPTFCYLLYDNPPDNNRVWRNALLYVNKEARTVQGRQKFRTREFKEKIKSIEGLNDQRVLTPVQTNLLSTIMGSDPDHLGKKPLYYYVEDLCSQFLKKMAMEDPKSRASSGDVLRFFTIMNQICVLDKEVPGLVAQAKNQAKEKHENEFEAELRCLKAIEREFQIYLIKLSLTVHGMWDKPINEHRSFADFDFELFEEKPLLFEKVWALIAKPKHFKGKKKLEPKHFEKTLPLKSNLEHLPKIFEKKITEQLRWLEESQAQDQDESKAHNQREYQILNHLIRDFSIPGLREKIAQCVAAINQQNTDTRTNTAQANGLLALSTPLLDCLIREAFPDDFFKDENLPLIAEFSRHQALFSACAPQLTHRWAEECKQSTQVLGQNFPELNQLLARNLDDPKALSEFFQRPPYLDNSPIKNYIDILNKIIANRKQITLVCSETVYERLFHKFSAPLIHPIKQYLKPLQTLDEKSCQRKIFGYFGVGHTIGRKKKAANKLIEAVKTGEYDALFADQFLMSSLKQGKLSELCKPLLTAIEQVRERRKTECGLMI